MEFKDLRDCDFNTLFNGFENAFADYEIHFQKEEVRSMLVRRGYTPELSFAMFEHGRIVSFTLNGTGMFHGLPTAYDTGTGTIKDYRGMGLAADIFNSSKPFLKEAGIKQYLLEVLQNNRKAIALYEKMGFETTREFYCFRQSIDNIRGLGDGAGKMDCTIKAVDFECVKRARDFCDFEPSWQNSMDSIERAGAQLCRMGAFVDGELAGVCVFDPETGDIAQIVTKPELRGRGIASQLLAKAVGSCRTSFVKVLNVCSTCHSLHTFLRGKNIAMASKQLEMKLNF